MAELKFPIPAGASAAQSVSRTADVIRVSGANEQAVSYYIYQLEEAGFTRLMYNHLPSGIFYAYTDGTVKLSISFLIARAEMRIFYEPMPAIPNFSAMGEKKYDAVTLTQFCTNTSRAVVTSTASGMGYVLRLTDGRLIVIDGGFATSYGDDYPDLKKLLWDLSDGQKPHVALWMISHPHEDHFGALMKFTEEDADIDAYMATAVPADTSYAGCANDMAKRVPHFDEKNVPAHAGDLYDFGDVKLEFYTTCEELSLYDTAPLRDSNNQSFIFAFHIGDQKVLFTGDAYHGAEEYALQIAAGNIRADICQIGHHGRTSHKDDLFYSCVAPKVALWPGCYAQIDNDLEHRGSNTWTLGPLSTVVDHYVAFDGTQTLTFPYEIQNLPYKSPIKK